MQAFPHIGWVMREERGVGNTANKPLSVTANTLEAVETVTGRVTQFPYVGQSKTMI